MPVQLTWSSTSGGAALADPRNLGSESNGNVTTPVTIHVRHDGAEEVTSCGFYIDEFSGVYTGDATAADDIAELRAWGDTAVAADYGGVEINQNATGGFPDSSWPSATSHVSADDNGAVFNGGQGSSSALVILLRTQTGALAEGTLQAGASPNVRFQLRCRIPTTEDTVGVRLCDFVMRYTFTS